MRPMEGLLLFLHGGLDPPPVDGPNDGGSGFLSQDATAGSSVQHVHLAEQRCGTVSQQRSGGLAGWHWGSPLLGMRRAHNRRRLCQ